jgi:hypothetical protein
MGQAFSLWGLLHGLLAEETAQRLIHLDMGWILRLALKPKLLGGF